MSYVEVSTDGPVTHILLNRPASHNALTPDMHYDLETAFNGFAQESDAMMRGLDEPRRKVPWPSRRNVLRAGHPDPFSIRCPSETYIGTYICTSSVDSPSCND